MGTGPNQGGGTDMCNILRAPLHCRPPPAYRRWFSPASYRLPVLLACNLLAYRLAACNYALILHYSAAAAQHRLPHNAGSAAAHCRGGAAGVTQRCAARHHHMLLASRLPTDGRTALALPVTPCATSLLYYPFRLRPLRAPTTCSPTPVYACLRGHGVHTLLVDICLAKAFWRAFLAGLTVSSRYARSRRRDGWFYRRANA